MEFLSYFKAMSSLHNFSEFWAEEGLLLLIAASFSEEIYQADFIINEM